MGDKKSKKDKAKDKRQTEAKTKRDDMKKVVVGTVLLALVFVQTAAALNVGPFVSYWDQDDGDAVMGGGVLLLPASLPIEIRGTFYDRSDTGELQVSPVDIGLTFGLTRHDTLKLSLAGGASYFVVESDRFSTDNEYGWYAGGRVELSARDGIVLFSEALYRGADLDDADFSGFTLNLGLLF